MNIRLIAMDLDGTALLNDHQTFSPRLVSALEKAHERGIAIVPVTGRQYRLLPPPLQEKPVWSGLAVLCNGGQIRELENGRVLEALDIPEKSLKQLLALARRFDIPLEFSREGRLHLTRRSYDQQLPVEGLRFHRDVILENSGVIVDSLEPLCEGAVEKAQLPFIPSRLQQAVEEGLKTIDVSAVRSSPTSMEITHSRATKGEALERVCRLLDIPLDAVLALGDSGNDMTMLQKAGLGIAMGNAPDFVKEAADAVTGSNEEDGAAKAIEYYALNIGK